jgi:hypothetical protein
MATYKATDSRAMMSAAESGQAGVRAQADRDQRERLTNREQDHRIATDIGQSIQAQQQINEQGRSNRAGEALQQQQLAETVRRNKMGEAIEQDQRDVDMADKGLESKGTSRADRLRGEMARGGEQQGGAGGQPQDPEAQASAERFKAQADKPLEVAGSDTRTIAPTEARKAETASKLTTNRMNAQANYLNAVRSFQETKLKGKAGDPEAMKRELQNLQQPIKEAARLFDAGKKGDLSDSQWEDFKALAGDAPDPALQQEIATKQFGPAMGRFLQARVSQSAIQFMAVTGDMPDGDLVDFAAPAMQEFSRNAGAIQQMLRAADQVGIISSSLGIQSLADRNRIVRKMTAQAMMRAKATPKPTGGELIPSQGGARAQPRSPAQQLGPGAAAGAVGGDAGRAAAEFAGRGKSDGPRGAGRVELPGSPGSQRDWNRDVR